MASKFSFKVVPLHRKDGEEKESRKAFFFLSGKDFRLQILSKVVFFKVPLLLLKLNNFFPSSQARP